MTMKQEIAALQDDTNRIHAVGEEIRAMLQEPNHERPTDIDRLDYFAAHAPVILDEFIREFEKKHNPNYIVRGFWSVARQTQARAEWSWIYAKAMIEARKSIIGE